MHPTFEIPGVGLAIPSQHLALAVVVLLGVFVGPVWIARLQGLDTSRVRRAELTLALIPFVTGRLHFLFNYPTFFSAHPLAAFLPWGGAIHMSGALIGLLIGVPLVCWWYGLPAAKVGDGLVPIVALQVAIYRVGCFLYGCCFGMPCRYSWCISNPPGSLPYLIHSQSGLIPPDAARSLPVHPEPIYFLAAALLTTALGLAVNRRKRYDGQVVWVGTVVFFGTSALLERFRAPELHRPFWGGIPQLTWTELVLAAVGVLGLLVAEVRARRAAEAPTIPPSGVPGFDSPC
jgi:phosphatidylglycerol:prolipoprotein diacylglycerol transferase